MNTIINLKVNTFTAIITLFFILALFNYNLSAQNNSCPASSEQIIIPIENDSIVAWAMLARGKAKKETVILLHGLPGNERNLDVAQELRRNGKNVIYFNYRGAWGSQGEFMYANCIEDVKKIIDFFSTSKNSDKYRIKLDSFILFGHSMGGGVALISGAKDNRVKKIAVYSPWNAGGTKFTTQQINGFKAMLKPLFMLNIEPKRFLEDIVKNSEQYSIINYKNQLKNKQVLIFDENERNKHWIENIENVEYILMKTDHSFSDKRLELIHKVSKWVNK
ncbi:alpha/beta hydrolase family protein [Pontimicrobium aquaticum]|uniref:Alpha/beta fold hydrolase n=1 Tax=Pontimicrobium aquaticum TaxID=2565367 RepID=A0A4U0F202_9FLAO|nr:alpha/beta fold hydrolase [Pontimicrobium aquaticum]TJY37804.1 alpha/beta fold hydrolase [Pontimicrobium aquaticum]